MGHICKIGGSLDSLHLGPSHCCSRPSGQALVVDRIRALLTRCTGVTVSGFALQPDREFGDCSNQCCESDWFFFL